MSARTQICYIHTHTHTRTHTHTHTHCTGMTRTQMGYSVDTKEEGQTNGQTNGSMLLE